MALSLGEEERRGDERDEVGDRLVLCGVLSCGTEPRRTEIESPRACERLSCPVDMMREGLG